MMNLDMLNLLADMGKPLHITTEDLGGQVRVTREDGRRMEYSPLPPGLTDEKLRHHLSHYPQEAWINGERLETSPAPKFARVAMLDVRGPEISDPAPTEVRRPEEPRHAPQAKALNTLAGSVCCRIENQQPRNGEWTYYSAGDVGGKYYSFLRVVAIVPHAVIETSELTELEELNGKGTGIRVPEGTGLERRVRERQDEMARMTREAGWTPDPHHGNVYALPVIGNYGDEDIFKPAPISIKKRAMPVLADPSMTMSDAEMLSVVDSLLWNESHFVPVMEEAVEIGHIWTINAWTDEPGKGIYHLDNIEFQEELDDDGATRSITLMAHVVEPQKDEAEVLMELPTRIHLSGDDEDNAVMRVTPGTMEKPELAGILVRAYWRDRELRSRDDRNDEFDTMTERMGITAMHLTGDNDGAVRAEMQRTMDFFSYSIPLPEHEISMVSRGGRMTLTLHAGKGGKPTPASWH